MSEPPDIAADVEALMAEKTLILRHVVNLVEQWKRLRSFVDLRSCQTDVDAISQSQAKCMHHGKLVCICITADLGLLVVAGLILKKIYSPFAIFKTQFSKQRRRLQSFLYYLMVASPLMTRRPFLPLIRLLIIKPASSSKAPTLAGCSTLQ
jgi:hypothetical protein